MKIEESIVHSGWDKRETAACPCCGFTRPVSIYYTQRMKITYHIEPPSDKWPGSRGDFKTEVSREPLEEPSRGNAPMCKACDYIARAEVHERTASIFRARAREIFEKRKERESRGKRRSTITES